MKRYVAALGSLLLFVFGLGCYDSSFVRNDGPVRAQGVAVALVGQRCDYAPDVNATEESNNNPPNRLELGVRLSIENASPEAITVQPENLRLLAGEAAEAPIQPPPPLNVAPGGTAKINLRFQHRGDLGCNANLSLGLTSAVLVGTKPVELRPVAFVPTSSET